MSTRVQQFTNTLADSLVPRVGAPITIELQTADGLPVRNLEGQTIFPGESSRRTTDTNGLGVYTISVDYLGDLSGPAWYVLDEDGRDTNISGLAYSGTPIDVFTLYPPVVSANKLLMRWMAAYADGSPIVNYPLDLGISDDAVATDGSDLLMGELKRFQTDSNGIVAYYLYPTLSLTPSDTVYQNHLRSGLVEGFTVPDHPLGWQGAWSSVTHYHKNLDTQASPSDVVSQSGVLYECVVSDSLNHAPPHADWITFRGERVDWHPTVSSGSGQRIITPSSVAPSSLVVALPDDHTSSPTSLDVQLENIHYRTRRNTVVKTTTYLATKDDDVIEVDGTSAAWTLTLMPVAQRDRELWLKMINATHAVTVNPDSSGETLDGSTSLTMNTLNQLYKLVPNHNNTKWLLV